MICKILQEQLRYRSLAIKREEKLTSRGKEVTSSAPPLPSENNRIVKCLLKWWLNAQLGGFKSHTCNSQLPFFPCVGFFLTNRRTKIQIKIKMLSETGWRGQQILQKARRQPCDHPDGHPVRSRFSKHGLCASPAASALHIVLNVGEKPECKGL